jgi:DNA-binding GntR family transcriptional regulator
VSLELYTNIPAHGPTLGAERFAYEVLKKEIIAGDLPGGTQLAQADIARRLGISRIPVRDAIRHLAMNGLVTLGPNRRAHVTVLRDIDLIELFQMRAVLEGLAARNAARNLKQKDLTELARLAEHMDEAEDKIEQWMPLHDEFHRLIYTRDDAESGG